MSNGTLTDSTVYVISGILGLLVIAAVVVGFVVQLTSLRSKAKAEARLAIDEAVADATKETESKIAFQALTKSVDAMNDTVSKLSKGVGDQISTIQKDFIALCGKVDVIDSATRSAHKRLDEHRKVEHGIPIYKNNNHFAGEDEELK